MIRRGIEHGTAAVGYAGDVLTRASGVREFIQNRDFGIRSNLSTIHTYSRAATMLAMKIAIPNIVNVMEDMSSSPPSAHLDWKKYEVRGAIAGCLDFPATAGFLATLLVDPVLAAEFKTAYNIGSEVITDVLKTNTAKGILRSVRKTLVNA